MGRRRPEVHNIVAFADGLARLTTALVALVTVWGAYVALGIAEGWWATAGDAALAAACAVFATCIGRYALTRRKRADVQEQHAAGVTKLWTFEVPPVPGVEAGDELKHVLHAGQLRAAKKWGECREALQQSLVHHPRSVKLAALYCRACSDEASALHRGVAQEDVLRRGAHVAELLVSRHPAVADGYRWRAVLRSRVLYYEPLKQQVTAAAKIKADTCKALELEPEEPLSLHLMGAFCHRVATMSWMEKQVARTALSTPLEGTLEEAFEYLRKADAREGFMENSLLAGDCLRALGQRTDAVQWYRMALTQLDGPKPADKWGAKIRARIEECER
eukprot:TRINITY_DN8943_c0_g2_i1.p1 TRINITY_DN8943_c0_g2~~TRINITY_DN8943_c0_g2_i1.p1  ORF type:complete len:333 (+),score=72.11 TRINITY_DN8943_c0_g2_i1:44-1042(+)